MFKLVLQYYKYMLNKLLHLVELVVINLKYIASNTSLMMSLSVEYPQILA